MKYLASAARRVISYAAFAAVVFAATMPAKPAASDDQRIVAAAPE